MKRSLRSRAMSMLLLGSALPLFVLGCPKKSAPDVPDSGAPIAVIDSGVTVVGPLDDGGDDGEAEAEAAPHHTGPAVNINTARIKQCCNAIRSQAKQLGASPEANILTGLALQCDNVASQASSGTAPEFAAFRQLLKGRVLPAGCQGL
jgi:hypothetical protein